MNAFSKQSAPKGGQLAQGQGLSIARARRRARKAPGDSAAQLRLARACVAAGQSAPARRAYGKALKLTGRAPELVEEFAGVLMQQADFQGAAALFEEALASGGSDDGGGNAELHNGLGVARLKQGAVEQAIAHFSDAIALDGMQARFFENLANALCAAEEFEGAADSFEMAHLLSGANSNLLNRAADRFFGLGQMALAARFYEAVVSRFPHHAQSQNNLGLTYRALGQGDAAERHLQQAVRLAPDQFSFLYNMSTVRRFQPDDPIFSLAQPRRFETADQQICYHFALATAYEDVRDAEAALTQYRLANQAVARQVPYEPLAKSPERLQGLTPTAPFEGDHPRPVFIVGLPRSGTTLVEQTLARHPGIIGLGERNWLAHAIDTCGSVEEVGQVYLSRLPRSAQRHGAFTDKMPGNFRYLDVICAAFPQAVILHVYRDPRAVAWSTYRTYFTRGGADMAYAQAPETISAQMRAYLDLMRHWDKHLPERVVHLSYEDFVDSPEAGTRRALAAIGLPWDSTCLDTSLSGGAIRTASALQANQPARARAAAWTRYQPWLGHWFEELGRLRFETTN